MDRVGSRVPMPGAPLKSPPQRALKSHQRTASNAQADSVRFGILRVGFGSLINSANDLSGNLGLHASRVRYTIVHHNVELFGKFSQDAAGADDVGSLEVCYWQICRG